MQELQLPDTLESCHALIRQLLLVNQQQQKQLEEQGARIASLEARLHQNSKNSSRPPSSNFGKNTPISPKPQPGLPKEGKNQGGQQGHKGNTLLKVETPDTVIALRTAVCTCGLILDPTQGIVKQSYQVFDLPEPRLQVTEYQRIEQKCNCGKVHLGALPDFIHANVQYGYNVRAFTTLLNTACQLSYEKISTLFSDLFGYDLNESTILSNNQYMYDCLSATEEVIKTGLIQSEVVHVDESGVKINKQLNWLHVASNAVFTYLFVHEKRGKKAHQDKRSILQSLKQWIIHDCLATYFTYSDVKHGLCNSHLLRELQFQIEQKKIWATEIQQFLLLLYTQTQKGTVPIENIAQTKEIWRKMCTQAIETEEVLLLAQSNLTPLPEITLFEPDCNTSTVPKKRGKKARGKALKLLDRLLLHTDAILAFAEFEAVPFSNNQAERDIRPIKTKLKVAGCFRTISGADTYARIQSFISTCRKNKLNVFQQLKLVAVNPIQYAAPFGC
jgi:transposase